MFGIGDYVINRKTTLYNTLALSSKKVEYIAITKACKKVMWLRGMFGKINEGLQIFADFYNS